MLLERISATIGVCLMQFAENSRIDSSSKGTSLCVQFQRETFWERCSEIYYSTKMNIDKMT